MKKKKKYVIGWFDENGWFHMLRFQCSLRDAEDGLKFESSKFESSFHKHIVPKIYKLVEVKDESKKK